MKLNKTKGKWTLFLGPIENNISLVDSVRELSGLSEEIRKLNTRKLLLEVDLQKLKVASSELISQLVIIQSEMVKIDGRLKIVNANHDLRSAFDVVMLDKVINIHYYGESDKDEDEEEDNEDGNSKTN